MPVAMQAQQTRIANVDEERRMKRKVTEKVEEIKEAKKVAETEENGTTQVFAALADQSLYSQVQMDPEDQLTSVLLNRIT